MPERELYYVVQPGDTLYLIARRFGTTVEELMRENQLTSTSLFVGQRLRIPVTGIPEVYTVRAGDTLFQLARRFNTTIEAIMTLNNLTSTQLTIGQELRVPIYTEAVVAVDVANIRTRPGTGAEIITQMVRGARLPVVGSSGGWFRVRLYNGDEGWIFSEIVNLLPYGKDASIQQILGFYTESEGPALPSSYQVFTENTQNLTNVGLFHFRLNRENPVEIEKFESFTDEYMRDLVQFGHRHNVMMLPVVHNLLYERGNQEVNKQVIREMLNTAETRRTFIQNLIGLIEAYNFDGVNIDFEDVYYEDRDKLSALYQEMGAALRNRGYFFSASVPSRTSDAPTNPFSAPFDYAVIGKSVDEFVAMLYNEHGWPGSGPGPVVSIGWMEQVINYAKTKMPASKIVAAVSVFGFDFNLATGRNTYVTYEMAMNRAGQYGVPVIFDEETQTPMFSYTDADGNRHEVWFENAASIRAKLQKAKELGIRGIALWRMGMEDPEIWTVIQDEFVVFKSPV